MTKRELEDLLRYVRKKKLRVPFTVTESDVAKLLGVTRDHMARCRRAGIISPTRLGGYDLRRFKDKRKCARSGCRRRFLSLNRNKVYCSGKCARHVSALTATRARRERERQKARGGRPATRSS